MDFYPIIFGGGFAAFKGLSYAHQAVESTTVLAIDKFEETTYPPFHKYITENLEKYTGETIIPSNEEIVADFFEDSEDTEGDWIVEGMLLWFLYGLENEAEEKIAKGLLIKKEDVHSVRLIGSGAVDGLFHGAFGKLKIVSNNWIQGIFMPYYWLISFFWLALMLFPIIEIIVARKRKNRAEKLPLPAENIDSILDL